MSNDCERANIEDGNAEIRRLRLSIGFLADCREQRRLATMFEAVVKQWEELTDG